GPLEHTAEQGPDDAGGPPGSREIPDPRWAGPGGGEILVVGGRTAIHWPEPTPGPWPPEAAAEGSAGCLEPRRWRTLAETVGRRDREEVEDGETSEGSGRQGTRPGPKGGRTGAEAGQEGRGARPQGRPVDGR